MGIKFQKKNQVKAAISCENKSRLRDRIKESLIGTLKSSKDMIIRKAKGLMLIFIGIIILGTFVINFAGTGMTGFMNSTSSVLTTSYLSKPNVLSEINQKFSDMEGELQSEVDHVKENYGLGGSATNDGGCGAAAALGVKFFDKDGKSFTPAACSPLRPSITIKTHLPSCVSPTMERGCRRLTREFPNPSVF